MSFLLPMHMITAPLLTSVTPQYPPNVFDFINTWSPGSIGPAVDLGSALKKDRLDAGIDGEFVAEGTIVDSSCPEGAMTKYCTGVF